MRSTAFGPNRFDARGEHRLAASLAALMMILTLGACRSIDIETDYDPSADFSNIRTFAWQEQAGNVPEDPRYDSSLLRERIERSIVGELLNRGYEKVEKSAADVLLGYHVVVDERVDVAVYDDYYGYGRGHGGWAYDFPYYPATSETRVYRYNVGSLILDMAEPKNGRLVWRATASARLSDSATPEEREARIRKAVDKMLDRFPPK